MACSSCKAAALLTAVAAAVFLLPPPCAAASGFVSRSGAQLVLDGSPFYFVGFNAYWMGSRAAMGQTSMVNDVMSHAQGLGLKVGRVWAFNHGLPSWSGAYDETDFRGLDFVVKSAAAHNVKLVLALGNLWPAYLPPEQLLAMAEGSAEGKDIATFYQSPATRELYKRHISTMVSRVNSLTGTPYNEDPTILGWDVLNEPRCPGCDSTQAAAHASWLTEMSAHLKAVAPKQLVFSATEGFFGPDSPYVLSNPGAGAVCEGEDFATINSIPNIEVATAHVYERHMEEAKQLGWSTPSFEQYVNWVAHRIDVFSQISGSIGRPFVIEEFGVTRRFAGEQEIAVVLAVVLQKLAAAQRAGSPFMGAMVWNAAPSGFADSDGYNIYLDRPLKVGFSLPSDILGVTTSGSPSPSPSPEAQYGRRLLLVAQLTHPDSTTTAVVVPGDTGAPGSADAVRASGGGSRLLTQANSDVLDAFRRGPARQACAAAAAARLEITLPSGLVDLGAYRRLVNGFDPVDVLAAGARMLQ